MSEKIKSLQSFRLFASLSVFQYHLWNNYLGIHFLSPATDFFILLVGFITAITQSKYIPSGNWLGYIWERYIRLYITFIPVYFVYMLAKEDKYTVDFMLKSFFFIPLKDQLPLVGPTWMLSRFLLFYWLVCISFMFKNEKVLILILSIWGAACLFFMRSNWRPPLSIEWFLEFFDERNLEFILGYAGGIAIRNQRIQARIGHWFLWVGGIFLVLGISWFNFITHNLGGEGRAFLFGLPMVALIIGLTSIEQGEKHNQIIQYITHPLLVWLGGTSYVLFLIHNMVLRVWDTLFKIVPLHVPLIIIAVLLLSALIYQFWEKPVLDLIHKKTILRQ